MNPLPDVMLSSVTSSHNNIVISSQTCPKLVNGFHDHKVVAIATGDEFSLVVDVKGLPWVWGKGDNGQVSWEREGTGGGWVLFSVG